MGLPMTDPQMPGRINFQREKDISPDMANRSTTTVDLLNAVRTCTLCAAHLPPRPERATWRARLMALLVNVRLTLVIGQYAQAWHLGERQKATLTATVQAWRTYWPASLPLPHPSPRNNIWLKRNAWFEAEVLPRLRRRVGDLRREAAGGSRRPPNAR